MLSTGQLLAFIPAALVVAASPGANNLLALRNGLRSGVHTAATALVGRFVAFAIMLTLVVAGLGTVLAQSQHLFELLKWLGVAYLLALGIWVIWQTRPSRWTWIETRPVSSVSGSSRLVIQEFTTAAANPKALLLFTAFLPQFTMKSAGPVAYQLTLLGSLYIVVEACAALGWASVGRWIQQRGLSSSTVRRVERSSGVVFVGLSGSLAASSLTPATR